MINNFFRLRLERELEKIYSTFRESILADITPYTDVLKTQQSVYLPINLGADWNCTVALYDPTQQTDLSYGSVEDFSIDVILRHNKLPDTYWADINLKVTYPGGQRRIPKDLYGNIGNVPTHVEYEVMLAVLTALHTAVQTIDFSTATVVFGKNDPNA